MNIYIVLDVQLEETPQVKSICIVTDKDLSTLKKYQKKFKIQFEEMKVSHESLFLCFKLKR